MLDVNKALKIGKYNVIY